MFARRKWGGLLAFLILGAVTMATMSGAREPLPYSCGFNTPQFTLGPLPQNGWTCDPTTSAFVQGAVKYEGDAALEITTGAVVDQTFESLDQVVWVDGYQKGEPSNVLPDVTAMTSGTAVVVFHSEGIQCLNGDGASSGTWVVTDVVPTADAWFRVTLKLNYTAKKYDCYVEGVRKASRLGFLFDNAETTRLNGFRASAGDNPSYLDLLNVTPTPPRVDSARLLDYLLGVITWDDFSDLEKDTADRNGDLRIDVADLALAQ